MKHLSAILLLVGIAVTNLRADGVNFFLDAGELRGHAASGIPAGMPVGGLLLLISNTGESIFQPAALNKYVTGDDSIVAAFSMNDSAGTNEVQASSGSIAYGALPDGGTFAANDELALRWFPGITYTQYEADDLPGSGQYYGTYSAGDADPDGGNVWVVPADTGAGQTWNLAFYTSDSDGGGSQAPSEGYANSQISAVPEPASNVSLLAGAIGIGAAVWRRRR